MARPATMQSVVLVEHDEVPPSSREPTAGLADRWRRARRWVAVAAVLVLVLAAAQAVGDARERAALAELAAVPGVVRPVDAGVRVLWTPETGAGSVLWSGLATDGALVGLERADDGSQALIAVDELTGERRWTTPLAPAHEVPWAAQDANPIGGCRPVPEVSDQALCLIADTFLRFGSAQVEVLAGELSRLVVLDTDDGMILADRPAPGVVAFTALPGLAVVGVPQEDGGVDLVGSALLTGDERWRTTLPALPVPEDDPSWIGGTSLLTTDDGFGVLRGAGRLTLLDREGVVLRDDVDGVSGYAVDLETGAVAVMSMWPDGGQRTTFLADGPDVVLRGRPVHLSVDDGSVPGLLLTSDTVLLHAYERGSSVPLWSASETISGSALVVRGRVYLSTEAGIVAMEGRTGEVLWRAPFPAGRTASGLATDGRHLLSAEQRPDAPGEASVDDRWPGAGELAAYRFADGGEDWRVDLPDDLMGIGSTGSLLLGWGAAGTSVLG